MRKTFKLNTIYIWVTIVLFTIEVLIALFVRDRFVRPYVGDYLVVMLIYSFFKSFWNVTSWKLCLYVFLFAVFLEIGQYYKLVELLGLGRHQVARTVIGTGFDWGDICAYALGVLTVWGVEWLRHRDRSDRYAIQ